jgi:hypothetical protein
LAAFPRFHDALLEVEERLGQDDAIADDADAPAALDDEEKVVLVERRGDVDRRVERTDRTRSSTGVAAPRPGRDDEQGENGRDRECTVGRGAIQLDQDRPKGRARCWFRVAAG